MDSAEPLSSILWTLTPHPGESLRRDIGLPRACCPFRQLNSGAGRSSPVRNLVQLFVFGPGSLAFQKILLGVRSFVFHYWWDGLFMPAATWGFAVVFRRICANRG